MARLKLKQFAKDLGLAILYDGGREEVEITTASVNRPGLQLSGYLHYFATERVQIIGKVGNDLYLGAYSRGFHAGCDGRYVFRTHSLRDRLQGARGARTAARGGSAP